MKIDKRIIILRATECDGWVIFELCSHHTLMEKRIKHLKKFFSPSTVLEYHDKNHDGPMISMVLCVPLVKLIKYREANEHSKKTNTIYLPLTLELLLRIKKKRNHEWKVDKLLEKAGLNKI